MKKLSVLLLVFLSFGVSWAFALTDAEKIERIMSVAVPAQAPRNFYRWQSETSGQNLLAAGEYNETLFKYFMGMTIDKQHFAGGHGVYVAEDITSSAQFIRGDGKGSLIEVRMPKGMPTIDLTKPETMSKLTKLGITRDDVLFLEPPAAVRYDVEGWWAIKRREGVKFQPFDSKRLSTVELVRSFAKISELPRAVEVLKPQVLARVDSEVKKNGSVLISNPEFQNLVSTSTLKSELATNLELQAYFQRKFTEGKFEEIPLRHFGTVIQFVRSTGKAIDEASLLDKMSSLQKLSYLDETYPLHNAPKLVLETVLRDRDLIQSIYKLAPNELQSLEDHAFPFFAANPKFLAANPASYQFLSDEKIESFVKSNEELKAFFTENLSKPGFPLPVRREVGPLLKSLKAAGVDFDEKAVFRRLPLRQRLNYLSQFYPNGAPPESLMRELLSKDGLRNLDWSPVNQAELSAALGRIAGQDSTFLIHSPDAFQYLPAATLKAVVAGNSAVRDSLLTAMIDGRLSEIEAAALNRLNVSLAAAGAVVSDTQLFKNLGLAAKLEFIESNFRKKNLPAPVEYIRILLDDATIRLNREISLGASTQLQYFINEALASNAHDAVLLERASRLYSFGKMKVDGRALIGFENRTPAERNALMGYASSYLRELRPYDSVSDEVRAKVFNSLVAANYGASDTKLYERLKTWRRGGEELTPENKLQLQSQVVEGFVKSSRRDLNDSYLSWVREFVQQPTTETAKALFAKCSSDLNAAYNCKGGRGESLNVFEQSAMMVIESNPETYLEQMKLCLRQEACWAQRALYNSKPPASLSRKQIQELILVYKAAPERLRVEFNDQIVTIVAKQWRDFATDLKDLLGNFSPGLYPANSRTDEIRIRRAEALVAVGNDMVKGMKPEDRALSIALSHAYLMDAAHERSAKKPDYHRVSSIESAGRDLLNAEGKLEVRLHLPVEAAKSIGPNPESARVLESISVEPLAAGSVPSPTCRTWFEKIGRLLSSGRANR